MSSRTLRILVGLAVSAAVMTVLHFVDEETRSWIRAGSTAVWLSVGVGWLAGKLYEWVFPRPE